MDASICGHVGMWSHPVQPTALLSIQKLSSYIYFICINLFDCEKKMFKLYQQCYLLESVWELEECMQSPEELQIEVTGTKLGYGPLFFSLGYVLTALQECSHLLMLCDKLPPTLDANRLPRWR